MSVRTSFYEAGKMCGAFQLAQWITRGQLRILCYHGFSFTDEHLFRPGLFHEPAILESRLSFLASNGYVGLSLDEAVARLESGTLGRKDLVITIDDGFYGVLGLAAPIFDRYGFKPTIYMTTYYMQHQNPIFRLAIQYMFWKTTAATLDLRDVAPLQSFPCATKGAAADGPMWELIDHGETELDETARVQFAIAVGKRLGVDYAELASSRRLSIMNESEVRDLARRGYDIQLHTHRHRMPNDLELVRREIVDNRRALEGLSERPVTHLCYPSGVWSPDRFPALAAEAMRTATTCEPGLNRTDTPRYALHRFLDSQSTPQIVFEAEVAGISTLVRRAAGRAG